MAHLLPAFMGLLMAFIFSVAAVDAARDTNSYDGNIFPIYAGNGSLVPPANTLASSLENERTSVIVYYLDDSATSKAFAPVVSGLKLLWSSSMDLLPITTDELQGREDIDPKEEGYYWRGRIPQVVVIDGKGNVVLDQEGQVPIDTINKAISKATGLSEHSFKIKITSFNEKNDGNYLIVLVGIGRFKIIEELENDKLYRECSINFNDFYHDLEENKDEIKFSAFEIDNLLSFELIILL